MFVPGGRRGAAPQGTPSSPVAGVTSRSFQGGSSAKPTSWGPRFSRYRRGAVRSVRVGAARWAKVIRCSHTERSCRGSEDAWPCSVGTEVSLDHERKNHKNGLCPAGEHGGGWGFT